MHRCESDLTRFAKFYLGLLCEKSCWSIYFLVYCCDLLGGSWLFLEVVPGCGELPNLTANLLPLATLAEANSGYQHYKTRSLHLIQADMMMSLLLWKNNDDVITCSRMDKGDNQNFHQRKWFWIPTQPVFASYQKLFLVKISHSANANLLVLLAVMISENLSLLPNMGAHSLLLRTTASLSDLSITKYSTWAYFRTSFVSSTPGWSTNLPLYIMCVCVCVCVCVWCTCMRLGAHSVCGVRRVCVSVVCVWV